MSDALLARVRKLLAMAEDPACTPGEAEAFTVKAAELIAGKELPDADENTLPDVLLSLMRDVGAPSGVAELGYGEEDVDDLVEGALKQQRLLVVAPREVTAEDLGHILGASMRNW